jgi:HAD superfamily hydrolase (TIGR01459 family)
MEQTMEHLPGFASLATSYDGFIIDLWGVIHDGVAPYPGAADVLARLRDLGKPVVLLSNAPRRSAIAAEAMRAMGLADTLYTGIMTSGEATWQALLARDDPWFAALGQRAFHLGPRRDAGTMEGLNLIIAHTPDQADFVVNTGPDDHLSPTDVSAYQDVLDACREAGLPMICANPDLEVIRGGERVICAGALAARYEAMGGRVRYFGKPDPAIYQPVLAMLGIDKSRVLAIGDALRTDIAGAAAAGLPSCWVLGGIHGAELGHEQSRIEAAAADAGLAPKAVIPAFIW